MTAQSAASQDETRQLGIAASLALRTHYRTFPIASLAVWIAPAIALRQIAFCFDARGMPAGYVTWALLADDVAARLSADADTLLHISEWNEGENLWIMDFVAMPGHARALARHARDALFAGHRTARGWRRRSDGTTRHATVRLRRAR